MKPGLPVPRTALSYQRTRSWVCSSCSARSFASTSPRGADDAGTESAGSSAPRNSIRRVRARSAAANEAIQNLNRNRNPTTTAGEATSSGSNAPVGSRTPSSQAHSNSQGLRSNTRTASASPQFRIIRASPNGAGQRTGARGPGLAARRKPQKSARRSTLLDDVEEEAVDEDAAGQEDQDLDISEEDLTIMGQETLKKTGILAASHGATSVNNLERRAAAIGARNNNSRQDEQQYLSAAQRSLHSRNLNFGLKGAIHNERVRAANNRAARSWSTNLTLGASSAAQLARHSDLSRAKRTTLARLWARGAIDSKTAKTDAKQKASDGRNDTVKRYATANVTYGSSEQRDILAFIERAREAARV